MISNTGPTPSRSRRTRSPRVSGSSSSTICWRPGERCRPRSTSCASAAAMVSAGCMHYRARLLAGPQPRSTCRSPRWSPTIITVLVVSHRPEGRRGPEAAADHGIERVSAAGRGPVETAHVGPVAASTKCCAIRQRCPASSSRHQQPIARVGRQRFENVTISGAPGFKTRPASRMTSQGRVRCWTETQIAAPSNSRSGERQARVAIQILYVPFVEKRVFRQLAGVEPDPDDPRIGDLGRQMADPARHQIEDGAAGRQDLAIEVGDRGDRRRRRFAGRPQIRRRQTRRAARRDAPVQSSEGAPFPPLQPVWLQIGMAAMLDP